MDNISMNHYEKQLYSVFKTFDVNNEEALNKLAVLNLCDALQLEDRGETLVDTLFDRRTDRVTFAQFRNGLLSVLGGPDAAGEHPAPGGVGSTSTSQIPVQLQSDDESSGREVAPKFVFGSKKYGRRSRPQRSSSTNTERPGPRAASDSRLNGDGRKAMRQIKCKRSISAAENREDIKNEICDNLDHDKTIDCEQALALCADLQMEGIDRRVVERIFEDIPSSTSTVGAFFDQLNSSLTSSIAATTTQREVSLQDSFNVELGEEDVTTDTVIELWEHARVPQPRRLLAELGFAAATLGLSELERALDDELRVLLPSHEPVTALPLAALAISRLRARRARLGAESAVAERDKLRDDLVEANRRAQLLAQDVDENHVRMEAELKGNLRQLESRHAEVTRAAAAEIAEERERSTVISAELEAERAARVEVEAKLRAQADTLRERCDELERRTIVAEQRAAATDRDLVRIAADLRAAEARCEIVAGTKAESAELSLQVEQLRLENKSLRDRNDELCAALEVGARSGAGGSTPRCSTSWREEAAAAAPPGDVLLNRDYNSDEYDSSTFGVYQKECNSLEAGTSLRVDADAQTDEGAPARRLADLESEHHKEKDKLNDLIKALESSLEQMKVEYEKCEEYWSSKVEEEREIFAEEQRASDERLGELVGKIGEYERQFAPRVALPAIEERRALEAQYEELERERRALEARLAAAEARLAAGEARGRRRAGAGGGAVRARLTAAEGAVARLQARLAAADLLVKDLYLENCQLAHAHAHAHAHARRAL